MSTPARRKKRFLAGFLAAVLAISVMPLAGTAQAEVLEPTAPGGFCEHAPTENPFTDVSAADPALAEIICQAAEEVGISIGFGDGTFRPNASTTRRQMALFMVRLADLLKAQEVTAGSLTALPPYDGVNQFPDSEAETSEVIAAINRLADAGIVEGTAPGTYSPAENVTRRHMLLFIVRLIEFVTGEALPEGAGAPFPDKAAQTPEVQAATNKLFEANVVEGKADGTFGYGDDVNRRQMTWFNMRTAQHHVERGLVDSPFPPPPPTTNQAFTVTPQEEAANQVSTGPADNTGRRSYSVSGLDNGLTYHVALVPAENVRVTGATVEFNSNALVTTAGVSIEVVNGATVGAAGGTETKQVADVAPQNGTITFAIDSTATDEVVPVVYQDADNDNALDLAPGTGFRQPTEPFGIGGQKNWVPQEAALGLHTVEVELVNRGMDYFIADTPTANGSTVDPTDRTFFYDANDTYQYQGVGITMAQFEGLLTGENLGMNLGDAVTINYNPNPAGTSVFNVTTDNVPPASNVTATGGDFDNDGTADDVRVRWTASAQPDAVYDIIRTTAADCITNATVRANNVSGTEHIIPNEATGTWYYCVRAEGGTSGTAGAAAGPSAAVTIPVPADTTAPTATYSALVTDGGFTSEADAGDQIRVIFSEPMAAVTSGDAIRLLEGTNATQDAGEEQYTLTCGSNVTCALNATDSEIGDRVYAAGRILTVTFFNPAPSPDATVSGGDSRLSFPAFIVNQSGFTDVAGNSWDVPGSGLPARTVERDAAAPDITGAVANATAQTVTLTYDRRVDCADTAAVRSQFTWTDADPPVTPNAITCDGTTTVVLTFPAGTLVAANAGTVAYTQHATDTTARMRGLNGREAISPDSAAATP